MGEKIGTFPAGNPPGEKSLGGGKNRVGNLLWAARVKSLFMGCSKGSGGLGGNSSSCDKCPESSEIVLGEKG